MALERSIEVDYDQFIVNSARIFQRAIELSGKMHQPERNKIEGHKVCVHTRVALLSIRMTWK
jgi:hypothetical protein